MIVVTGGAGFIGANIISALNARGETQVLLVDDLTRTEKVRNIADLSIFDYMDKDAFREAVRGGSLDPGVRAVFHQGACSDTMATDGRYVMENNYAYSKDLLHYCRERGIPFIYASSASVYGANQCFTESPENERPLNAYAYSKFQFDNHVRSLAAASGEDHQVVGLRYFNVYGYREQHKHRMASVAYHFFNQFRDTGKVRLFAGSGGYADGEQRRDFVFIEDVVAVNMYFLDHPGKSGIFNVGTGRSATFNDVACAVINTVRRESGGEPLDLATLVAGGSIEYVPMPAALEGKYQSFTEADPRRLTAAGCPVSFHDVPNGVAEYVRWMLRSDC